jgi:hypothetical protein
MKAHGARHGMCGGRVATVAIPSSAESRGAAGIFPACGPGNRYRSSAGPIGLDAGPAGKESLEKGSRFIVLADLSI